MTHIPVPRKSKGLTDLDIYNNAYDEAYAEAVDAGFTLDASDKWASTYAMNMVKTLALGPPRDIDKEVFGSVANKTETAPAKIISAVTWKPTAMRTISDLADAVKKPGDPVPVRKKDADLLDDDEWAAIYGRYY